MQALPWMRRGLPALALALSLGLAAANPALAQAAPAASAAAAPAEPRPDESNAERNKTQPGNNAPFWRAVRESGVQQGYTSQVGPERGMLIQPFVQYPGSRVTTAGEAWRQVRNQWILPYGGSLLLITVLALAIFYWRKGALGGHIPDTGRKIERFTPLERAAHWTNAGAFLALAVSGIVMAFGKFFLLPVLGGTLFGWLAFALKNLHNFIGPLFAVSLVIVLVTFVKDNIASAADFVWLSRAGGMLGDGQVPSHRFNAAEKGLFWWGVCVPGLVVVASGLILDQLLPGLGYLRGDMQLAHMFHAVAAVVMMVALTGHIYMGTVGVKGALEGMKTGWVDEAWAQEHHVLWYDDVKAGKISAHRSRDAASARPGVPGASAAQG
ncbi:formate dehydrogenase, gamma subunit [Burkholderiales bacterium JOSHI_001]|nr:formate dehydrogenase, gamma subunit [Burkholderiales bacterium JOSHI_001]